MKVILASASPRRRDLLKYLYDDFEVIVPHVNEDFPEGLDPDEGPQYVAVRKTLSVAKDRPDYMVIGSDTSVILDDVVLGKPENEEEAAYMLRQLSGRTHRVITGCCVAYKGKNISFSRTTAVRFYSLSDEEIDQYIRSGEPFDKAGSYGAQGKGMLLIHSIEGDYQNVVGLPVAALKRVIARFLEGLEEDL